MQINDLAQAASSRSRCSAERLDSLNAGQAGGRGDLFASAPAPEAMVRNYDICRS
jgi:hypothetical protein